MIINDPVLALFNAFNMLQCGHKLITAAIQGEHLDAETLEDYFYYGYKLKEDAGGITAEALPDFLEYGAEGSTRSDVFTTDPQPRKPSSTSESTEPPPTVVNQP